MSGSNPYKKRRAAKKTALFYCEGEDDKVFLEYLKMTFAKDSGVAVRIKQHFGGGAEGVLRGVLKIFKNMPMDIIVCMYDTDTGIDIALKRKVEKEIKKIVFIEHKPCLEAFLLEIIEGKSYAHHQRCHGCKKRFENKYLDKKKRKDKRNYSKVFPESLLLRRVLKMKNLKMTIDIMSGRT